MRISFVVLCLLTLSCTPEVELVDADRDGRSPPGDCDDSDPLIHFGALELCDGVDNDCDDLVDEEDAIDTTAFYGDADGDGWGVATDVLFACEVPEGYAERAGDCDDDDEAFHPGAPEDDCADPADYNCDGSVGFEDVDGDGVPACEDCDDRAAEAFPGGTEVCDGLDNDCNGVRDDAATDAPTWYLDDDGDGYGDPETAVEACEAPRGFVANEGDCDDEVATSNPASYEVCDGVDNDCDGAVDEDDAINAVVFYEDGDGDGYGTQASVVVGCAAPTGYAPNDDDCDDGEGTTNPGAAEYCDSVDNDCDGGVDEADAVDASTWYLDADLDGFGVAGATLQACWPTVGWSANTDDCDDTDAASTNLTIDGDCDGTLTLDDCDDTDANSTTIAVDGDCDGVLTLDDCDDNDPTSTVVANDADCDGTVTVDDCDDTDPTSTIVANDADCDGSVTGVDCDDNNPLVYPGAVEIPGDGLDNDCDGTIDNPNWSGVLEMPAAGTVDGFAAGPWATLNNGGRAATRLQLTQSCVDPQIALFQHPTADTSIYGSYYLMDASGTVLASSAFQTYSGCNNCWLPHPGRLSVTLASGQIYWIAFANGVGFGDMSGPSIYQDSNSRTVGIATFDLPRADDPNSNVLGLPANTATWQNRWRIDCL